MLIINGERGSRRTTILICASYVSGERIVCPTRAQAQFVKEQAERMGLPIKEPMMAFEYAKEIERGKMREESAVLVDNADWIIDAALEKLLGKPARAITINKPNALRSVISDEDRKFIRNANPRMYAEEYCLDVEIQTDCATKEEENAKSQEN